MDIRANLKLLVYFFIVWGLSPGMAADIPRASSIWIKQQRVPHPVPVLFESGHGRMLAGGHWFRDQKPGPGCADVSEFCRYWATKYCGPNWVYKGKRVAAFLCRKTCGKCDPQGQASVRKQKESPPPANRVRRTAGGSGINSFSANSAAPAGSYESELLSLVNVGRAGEKAPPLCMNEKLNRAAKAHCEDMNENRYFSHTSLDGTTFDKRISREQYAGMEMGENIAYNYPDAQSVYQAWKLSPGHWGNIKHAGFQHMGIAHVGDYWCQEFGASKLDSCS